MVVDDLDIPRVTIAPSETVAPQQCSGELTLLADVSTLVLTYDHRFHDRFSRAGDPGATWEPDEYVLGEGESESFPGGLAMDDRTLITV